MPMNNPFERFSKPPQNEEPFDPHSVPSIVTIEQQKQEAEIRKHLAIDGEIPPESVSETGGVDISRFRAPQYSEKNMQKDMDAITPLQEGTPAEFKKKLRELVGRFIEKTGEGSNPNAPEQEDTSEIA